MVEPVLLGPHGAPLPRGIGQAVRAMASASGQELGYRPPTLREQALDGWNPPLLSADAAITWSRDDMVAKARDLYATEPWAQGGIERKLDMLVGSGWRPSIKPDAATLGITDEQAAKLGRSIERCHRLWAEDPLCRCDAEETLNAGWQLHLLTMEFEVVGDGLGVLRWQKRPDWGFRTSLQVIDADRLSNPNNRMPTADLNGGVERAPNGRPVAYHFRNAHPGDIYTTTASRAFTWERVERREPWGRPKVLHLYRKNRPGQTRGVSKLIAGLARFKQLQRFADAELSNAVINALFAATITSGREGSPEDMGDDGSQELRSTFYDTMKPTLGGVRVQPLWPGDKLDFNALARSSASFDPFTAVFLRSLASLLDIGYEQLTMDFSKTNYSSVRAMLVEVYRGIMKTRSLIAMMVATPLLLAVTEDGLDQGIIDAPRGMPELYAAPAAWLRGTWIGPAKGWVDPVKEPQGALMAISTGLSNWEEESAEQGIDFEMNVDALKRQKAVWEDAGLMPPAMADMLAVQAPTDGPPVQSAG